jgi:hypothetical protein
MKANCQKCEKSFNAESMTWARNIVTGEECSGGDGKGNWFGISQQAWPASEVQEFEQQIGGVGSFGLCPPCVNTREKAMERARGYMSDVPPADFDPDYCGERWSDDY